MPWQGITITDDAITAAKDLAAAVPERADQSLRLWLEGKGCDGFYYGINFDDAAPNDIIFESSGVRIVVDPDTIEFVDGSIITWVDDERGRGFLVDNPRHKKFRGKFYKRENWQERLKSKRAATEHKHDNEHAPEQQ